MLTWYRWPCQLRCFAIGTWLCTSVVFNSPLTMAAAQGNPDVVRLLLMHGADPNRVADSLVNPAVAAAVHGRWGVLDILESTHDQHVGGLVITSQDTQTQERVLQANRTG